MERSRGKLMGGDRGPPGDRKGSLAFEDRPGFQEWRGRFWLHVGDRIQPGDRYCLIHDDRRDGGPFGLDALD